MAKRKRERRKRGTGYASQARNKTWTAFYPKIGGGQHARRGFDTRASAEAWLDSLVAQSNAKGDVAGGQQRTSDWIDIWATRAAKDREWKAKMIADVSWKLGYVKPHLGDRALLDVLPDHVDAMLDQLRQSLAETTIRQIRNYLWQVFEEARERRYITYNPVVKPKRRKRAKQKEPQRLSVAETRRLLAAAEASFHQLAWWLIVTLGMRAGEICGLRWCDVDLERCIIHIQVAVAELHGKPHHDTPKNDKKRHVAFARALVPLFVVTRQAVERRAAQGTRRGYWRESDLIFPGRGGRPMNPIALRHQLHDLTDAAQLPPVTTHNLRHTAAKFYADIGADERMIGAILGHAPSITGHYAPPGPDAQRPWVEKVYTLLTS